VVRRDSAGGEDRSPSRQAEGGADLAKTDLVKRSTSLLGAFGVALSLMRSAGFSKRSSSCLHGNRSRNGSTGDAPAAR